MNTAATLWCSAAIGTLVGLGWWHLALLGTIGVVGAHFAFRPIAHAIDKYTQGKGEMDLLYELKLVCQRVSEEKIRSMLLEQLRAANLRLQGLSLQDAASAEQVEMNVHLFTLQHNEQVMNDLVSQLASQPEVFRVSWGKHNDRAVALLGGSRWQVMNLRSVIAWLPLNTACLDAIVFTWKQWPPVFMWFFAFTIYASRKWPTWRTAPAGSPLATSGRLPVRVAPAWTRRRS